MKEKAADLILRVGIAFSFLYPPIDAIADPYSWIGYFPKFVHGFVPDLVLLHGFGVIEVIIALWILSGKKVFYPALAAALLLCLIVLFNLSGFPIVFRDLTIAAAALALALWHAPGARREQEVVHG